MVNLNREWKLLIGRKAELFGFAYFAPSPAPRGGPRPGSAPAARKKTENG